jgi:hypothetical protein
MVSFRSKYDVGPVALALVVSFVALYQGVRVWEGGSWLTQAASGGFLALWLVTLVWTFANVRYVVGDDTLVIHSGPLCWTVPIDSIRSVTPHRFVAGLAWSWDGLSVNTGKKSWQISPRDRAGFLDALLTRDAGLRRDGERLVRADS